MMGNMGDATGSEEERGIIPRAVRQIFGAID